MPNHILTADSTAPVTLANGEAYYLRHDVSHIVELGAAVQGGGLSAGVSVGVDGAIVAVANHGVSLNSNGTAIALNVQIGEAGTIRSLSTTNFATIRLDSGGGSSQVANMGELTADVGVILIDGRYTVDNGGRITALDGYGVWVSTSAGSVVANSGVIQGESAVRFDVLSGTGAVNNTGQLIAGAGNAVYGVGASVVLENAGEIVARNGFAYYASVGGSVLNTGEITGVIDFGTGDATLLNSGVINGYVEMGSGTKSIVNTGEILGQITSGGGVDRFENSGVVAGQVNLGEGTADVENSGEIGGDLRLGASGDTVLNAGVVMGRVLLSDGADTFVNVGVVVEGVAGGNDGDKVINRGSVQSLSLLGGDDLVRNNGVIDDFVLFSSGENVLRNHGLIGGPIGGGSGADLVVSTGTIGDDVNLGATADKVLLRGGVATGDVNLGQGNDTFRATGGAEVLGMIRGQDDNDRILGSSEIDRIEGGGGFDTLKGRGGDDEIKGGAGDDTLVGGGGDDEMTGGINADEFRIGKHSGADVILDWEDGVDVLNLRKLGMTGGTKLGDVIAASENRIGGAVIIDLDDIGGDGSITVESWNVALMTVDDFIF